jgi:chaperonin GroEL
VNIVKKALERPIRQIAINAGKEGSEVLAKIQGKELGIGYNAQTDTYGKLFEEGVIDPTKVVRNALQTSASIAALVLTTEGLVADFEDEKDKNDLNPSVII